MKTIDKLNKAVKPFGYTVIETEKLEYMQNMLQSLLDAIKVYENKEEQND